MSDDYNFSPFYKNSILRAIDFSGSTKEIKDNEFLGCENLRNVKIGNSIKTIGKKAFSGCHNLHFLSFGSGLESIGEEALSDCLNLTLLVSHATKPPYCGFQALDDINKWECVLMIPIGTLPEYKQADQWKDFFFMEDVVTGITNRHENKKGNPQKEIYNLQGIRFSNIRNIPSGYYIKNGKKYYIK